MSTQESAYQKYMSIPELLSTGYTPLPHEHQLVPDDRRFNLICFAPNTAISISISNRSLMSPVFIALDPQIESRLLPPSVVAIISRSLRSVRSGDCLNRLNSIVKKIGPIDQIAEQYFELST